VKNKLKEIDAQFVATFDDCERFACLARGKEFQIESCEKLDALLQTIKDAKRIAIQKKDENAANRLLYYEQLTRTLISELRMWISFKENLPEQAWGHLVNAQTDLKGALMAFDVGDILDPYVEKLSVLEELLFPKMLFASVGIKPKKKTCSICNSDYEGCDHIKGRAYMGQLCTCIIEECELEEVSIVEDPANKHCRIMSITEGNFERNAMTWEIIEPKEKG
jgi:hypothetical protein